MVKPHEPFNLEDPDKQNRVDRRRAMLDIVAEVMFWAAAICFVLAIITFAFVNMASGAERTFAWHYPKHVHQNITGYRLYMGATATATTTLVADIAVADVAIKTDPPLLVSDKFDTDPGTKYTVTEGSWRWDSTGAKAMKIEGAKFMVVFEVPAGTKSTMSFEFYPEKSLSDQPIIYSYIKDESLSAYYELRVGGADGIRTSTWRKCYDGQWGGVDGAFGLPRYEQCFSGEPSGDMLCKGFGVYMSWAPGKYAASVLGDVVSGDDTKALDINKLEIIINNQTGWLDNIQIGPPAELRAVADVPLPASGSVWFAISAYRDSDQGVLEGPKSASGEYVITVGDPQTPGGLIYLEGDPATP